MKSQFLPLFNVNLSQLQLNSISTKLPLNLISTLFQPQAQINLNSTTTITSTQYGCDIKATQSCSIYILMFKRVYNESYKSRDSFFRKISNTKLTYSRLTTMNELLDYTISNPNRKIIWSQTFEDMTKNYLSLPSSAPFPAS